MNSKRVLPVAWAAALLSTALPGAGLLAQTPLMTPPAGPSPYAEPPATSVLPSIGGMTPPPPPAPAPPLDPPPPIGQPLALPKGAVASPWIAYARPACCGPLGADGPITYEIYVRTGPTFIAAGGILADSLDQFGWEVAGGGRTYFWNATGDRAWVIDVGIDYRDNGGRTRPPVFMNDVVVPANIVQNPNATATTDILPVSISGLSRTAVTFGVGRDWFMFAPGFRPDSGQTNLRYGAEVGGHYGSAHVDMFVYDGANLRTNSTFDPTTAVNYSRENSVFGAVYLGAHADVEIPMGSWFLVGGLRATYDYFFSSLIPGMPSDLHNFSILLNAGVRF
jgi:hypothetical protein